MPETHWSKSISDDTGRSHEGDEETAKASVKRRLSWKTTRENLVRWHQHALWDRRAHDQGVDCVGTIHGENQGDSAWTGEILDETKSDLEQRKQSA